MLSPMWREGGRGERGKRRDSERRREGGREGKRGKNRGRGIDWYDVKKFHTG